MFKEFDHGNDGFITFDEFKSLAFETDYSAPQQNNLLLKMRAEKILKKLVEVIWTNHIDIQ
jgi:Ca2+-binding EF-hand superfamily protein